MDAPSTGIPLIFLFERKLFASNSTAITNSAPDRGSPSLTPLSIEKYSDVYPLSIMQLFALL